MINFAYYGCWLLIIYVGFKYLLPIFLPFLLGYLFTVASRKLTRNQSTYGLVLMYVVLGLLLVLAGVAIVNWVSSIIALVPDWYKSTLEPYINDIYNAIKNLNDQFDFPYINNILDSALDALKNMALSLGSTIVSALSKGIKSIPSILISILVFVVSSFFMASDYDRVYEFIETHIGKVSAFAREKMSAVLLGYLKIMGITFVELLVGLGIMGTGNLIVVAMSIAILDILPLFGCGTALIPWGIGSLIIGQYGKGIGLLVLYIIITVIRQYIEPKIVGQNLGIPPIVSLISMVVGLRLFGFAGLMGCPLLAAFLLYNRNAEKAERERHNESNASLVS